MIPAFQQALHEWSEVLGPEHVLTDPPLCRLSPLPHLKPANEYPRFCGPPPRTNTALPSDRQQAPHSRLRNQQRIQLGLRIASAGQDNCVILDLRRMNRILDFSEELAYITVEPGVTQRQVIEFLQRNKSRLWIDATGSTPDRSLIGNTMERGFGHTPYGDHFANSCALEVVLPDGDCAETGFRDSQMPKPDRSIVGASGRRSMAYSRNRISASSLA